MPCHIITARFNPTTKHSMPMISTPLKSINAYHISKYPSLSTIIIIGPSSSNMNVSSSITKKTKM